MKATANAKPRNAAIRAATPVSGFWWRLSIAAAVLMTALVLGRAFMAGSTTRSLQQPMLLLVLAAALVFVFVMLLKALRAIGDRRQPAPLQTQAIMGWSRLTRLATRYFDAHDLVPETAEQGWTEAADLVLHRGRHRYLLHAGLWRATHIDAAAVQKLAGDVARQRAQGAILLCARDSFTAVARQLARQRGIVLLHPGELEALPERGAKPRSPAEPPHPAAARAMPAPVPRAPARQPVLRPDNEFRAPRCFMPTVPMVYAESDL